MRTFGLFSRRSQRGTALIVVMAIVMLLAGLATVLLNDMTTRSKRTDWDAEDVKAFEAAEAGLDAAIMKINAGQCPNLGLGWRVPTVYPPPATDPDVLQGFLMPAKILAGVPNPNGTWQLGRWKDGNRNNAIDAGGEWTPAPNTDIPAGAWQPSMDNVPFPETSGYVRPKGAWVADTFGSTTYTWPRPQPTEFNFYNSATTFGDVRYFTYAIPWIADGIDNDGNGHIDGINNDGVQATVQRQSTESDWYTIYSTGFSNPSTAEGKFVTVEATVQRVSFQNTFNVDSALEFQVGPYKAASNTSTGASSTATTPPPNNTPASAPTMVATPTGDPPYYSQIYPFLATDIFTAVFNGNPTTIKGTDYRDVTPLTVAPDQSLAKAAIGVAAIDATFVNGPGSGNAMTGISIGGNPATTLTDIVGGLRNDLRVKDADIDRFVLAVKNVADYTVNLATASTTAVPTAGGTDISLTAVGGINDYKVVYAKGAVINGTFVENPIHLSGNGTSYGLLVVEIDNPVNSYLDLSGSFQWTGLVLVVTNKRFPAGSTDSNMDDQGGGNKVHYLGAAIVYHRNFAISPTVKGELNGMRMFRTRGTSDLAYSSEAVLKALGRVKLSAKVKSWRKLD